MIDNKPKYTLADHIKDGQELFIAVSELRDNMEIMGQSTANLTETLKTLKASIDALKMLESASQSTQYYCAVCHEEITGDDIDNRHSLPDGEDCHEKCCQECAEV